MIKAAIAKIVDKKDLSKKEAETVMGEIMTGQATPSQIAGFLVALRNKGESIEEIAGCALAMRGVATKMVLHNNEHVDCCGTGGDGKGSLNISTAAAFVVSGAGFSMAKHGNRSVSSHCGSADVLEEMGVNVGCPSVSVERSLDEAGIGFMFAPSFHPAMKYAVPTRKELGIRTIFNILGPLSNPARAQVQLIGVFKPEMIKLITNVMKQMGHKGGLVVHSQGWDEVTLDGTTVVGELLNKKVKTYKWTAKSFGLPKVSSTKLKGGDAKKNADIIVDILKGKKIPARHVVVANAAALIWIAERAYGKKTSYSLKDAVKRAEESIDSGKALGKSQALAQHSHLVE